MSSGSAEGVQEHPATSDATSTGAGFPGQLGNDVEKQTELRESAEDANSDIPSSKEQEKTSPSSAMGGSSEKFIETTTTDEPDVGRATREEANAESDWPLRATFGLSGKAYEVELNETRLLWWPASQGKTDRSTKDVRAVETEEKVLVTNILGAKPRHRTMQTQHGSVMVPAGFTVFYVCKKKRPRWRERRVYFDHTDINTCRRWAAQIEILAKGTSSRPRMLKVFINPAAGKKHAVRIFQQEVVSVLKICDIRWETTVSEKPGHVSEIVQQIDLDSYDGLVVIGGDGTVNELVDGLLKSTCLGLTPDRVSPCDIRIGIIPAGTNNQIANTVYGTADPETSLLHIAIGNSRCMDVLSMAHRSNTIRFGLSCGYGFPADFIVQSRKHSWFRKAGLASLPAVKQHRPYPCQVHFLLIDDEEKTVDGGRVARPFKVAEWKVVKGPLSAVIITASRMASEIHPDGLWPEVRNDDGYGRVVVVEECSRSKIMRYHKRLSKSGKRPEDLDFVHSYKVRAVRLRPLQREASLENSPAEVQTIPKATIEPDIRKAEDSENTQKVSTKEDSEEQTTNNASSTIPVIVVDLDDDQTKTEDQTETETTKPLSFVGAGQPASGSESKEEDKKSGDEIEELGKTSQPSFLNPSPQPARRRGFSFSLRQRLATFSPRRVARATTKKAPKKKFSLEVHSTAAGDTLVRRGGVRATSPLPPGGPPADFNESDVDPEGISPWVIDGELIREPFIDIRIHQNLISFFVSETEAPREE